MHSSNKVCHRKKLPLTEGLVARRGVPRARFQLPSIWKATFPSRGFHRLNRRIKNIYIFLANGWGLTATFRALLESSDVASRVVFIRDEKRSFFLKERFLKKSRERRLMNLSPPWKNQSPCIRDQSAESSSWSSRILNRTLQSPHFLPHSATHTRKAIPFLSIKSC